jgi:integrase
MPTPRSLDLDGVRRTQRKKADGTIRWLYRVEDEGGHETSKYFELGEEDAAREWAISTRKHFIKGATAGQASLLTVGLELVEKLRGRGFAQSYCDDIENVVRSVDRAGIRNLKDDDFATDFERWLTNLKPGWSTPKGEENKFAHKSLTKLSACTKNKLGTMMRRVVNYAMSKPSLAINRDPLAGFEPPRRDKKIKPTFEIDELRKMVSDDFREDAWWLANCALVYTGCRAQEAMHLKWESIRWDREMVDIKLDPNFDLKFQKERMFPLQPEYADLLDSVLKERGLTRETARGYIIDDKDMRERGVCLRTRKVTKELDNKYSRAFRLMLGRLGIDVAKRSTHSTRHTFITMQLAGGVDFYRLMTWVGHEEESTTLGYGKNRSAYEKAVEGWPVTLRRGVSLCLRHDANSRFHHPEEFENEDQPVVITGLGA